MTKGRLIAVVGPSGVGKDTIMRHLAAADAGFSLIRRTITRDPDLGGEDYIAVTEEKFQTLKNAGAFCVDWQAHGLSYGVPFQVHAEIAAGRQCLVNFSRGALKQAARTFPNMLVLNITANHEILAQRLQRRGRETTSDIQRRLSQASKPIPDGLQVITIANDGALDATVAAALTAIQPVKG